MKSERERTSETAICGQTDRQTDRPVPIEKRASSGVSWSCRIERPDAKILSHSCIHTPPKFRPPLIPAPKARGLSLPPCDSYRRYRRSYLLRAIAAFPDSARDSVPPIPTKERPGSSYTCDSSSWLRRSGRWPNVNVPREKHPQKRGCVATG